MYLQIRLQPSDRSYHRFLWRDLEQTRPPEEYEFERVVFGVNASPFMAQFVVQEHAKSHQAELPMAADTVLKSTYMDDNMDSVPDVESGCELYNQLSKLWGAAGMHARKWLSNSPEVLACIPPEDRAAEISLEEGELPSVKTLGVLWRSKEDVFAFQPSPLPADYKLTKRSILRKLATIFDPLGFISPFIVRGKIIIQELWAAGLEWDEPVVGDLAGKVDRWFKEISILINVQLPRCLRLDEAMEFMSLHCFVDASQEAYGGVVYAITKYKSGHIESRFVASKTRVVPLSATSVPRLELIAAVLGLGLAISIVGALELSIRDVTFWSDSMNVLWWVCRQSRKFKPFVANRVGEIQEMTEPKQWRYFPTSQNPADLLSRGMRASDLVDGEFWWSGPGFLKQAESRWPENKVESGFKEEDRKQGTVSVSMLTMTLAHSTDCQKSFRLEPSRYSDWSKYIRVRSWVQRFLDNCRSPEPGRRKGELCPEELRQSEKCVIRGAQRSAFPNEYQALLNGRLITASSKILSLNPKLDDEALLRCDGRLRNADFLSYDARYPIILPRKNWLTKLIVKQFHDERHHVGGKNQILADLSSKYWIIAAREEIRDWEENVSGVKDLKQRLHHRLCHRFRALG
ncbi:uncharacterized protein [Apostichopus japonicus]|uniref:uncharacterized protein n=1 Tax=Stichopus japonicus TaxID=307972 RepID=UPI003AB723E0